MSFLSRLSFSGYKLPGISTTPVDDENAAVRALPANWYTSPEMYELEQRAIFSKKWMLITHSVRLPDAGNWLLFDVAGFPFILTRDRQGEINGFHNVCRHRAYPVISGESDSGCAKILSCKYHGWSYGLNGKLAKAPGYEKLEGFEKEKNGLFRIHVRTDVNGFIWINLDSKDTPEVPWEEDFDGIDKQERYKIYNFDDYRFDHSYEMNGPNNWKILADNYNECYHCATTHPDIGALADLDSYSVTTKGCQIIHDPATTDEQAAAGLTVASTYYFPNVSTNVSPHFFMIQRFVPDGPASSSMQYQIFRNKNSSEEDFAQVRDIYSRVMSEDKELCGKALQNINRGVFVNGELHPQREKGPLHFQKVVRQLVTDHHKREKAAKQKIYPACQQLPESAKVSQDDVDFCESLSCETKRQDSFDALQW